jgi:hypothetical protein
MKHEQAAASISKQQQALASSRKKVYPIEKK